MNYSRIGASTKQVEITNCHFNSRYSEQTDYGSVGQKYPRR